MFPLLSIQNLSVDFISESGITPALRNISFSIKRGEITAIVGESGSGKSVTSLSILRLLANAAHFNSGEIFFSDDGNQQVDLLELDKKQITKVRGNKIAMIFQEPMTSLNPVFTCGHQVTEAICLHRNLSKSKAKLEALEWFGKVKLPDPFSIYKRYPHQLSGGQKQRVMIAMAMCCHPSLLICDEPTTALDVTVQKTILRLIRELQQEQNIGVIFVTHDLGVVAEVADRALVMYKGEIVEQNSVKELFERPQHPYTKALLACRPVLHQKGERLPVVSDFIKETIETREPGISKHDTNSEKSGQQETNFQLPPPIEPLLKVQNLSVWFPVKKTILGKPLAFTKAVDDVSFEVMKGETLGLVGESGCGKTTLGRTLLRLVEPTAGKIIYDGVDLTAKERDGLKPLRRNIQIIFQDPYSSLNPRITIGSAIAEPLKVHGLVNTERQRKEKVVELLDKVNLEAKHFSRYPHEFSGGQRQRIVIARALALNPSFIVCDESVSSLDVSVQAQVLNLLNDIKKEFGFTVIFISHDLAVVRYISDRIMVMYQGKLIEKGTADDIYFHPQQEYTKNLIASIPGTNISPVGWVS